MNNIYENNPLVSVLIVAYNPGNYLEKTLNSCINQTYKNLEILVLDNASKEDIRAYFPKDSRIAYFRSEKNLGPYGGLNFLLEKAS